MADGRGKWGKRKGSGPRESSWLKGEHVVVTGGSSGIGYACARLAARGGARVTLLAKERHKLEAAAGDLREIGCESTVTQQVDVTKEDQTSAAIAKAAMTNGPVAFLICSAGTSLPARFEEQTAEEFDRALAVNISGSANAARAALSNGLKERRGRILFISSIAGQVGLPGFSAYSASKFAVRGLAESLQSELSPCGVSVSVVFPPDTDTPLLMAENERKPPELKEISSTAGTMSPYLVARSAFLGSKRRLFFVPVGLDSWLVCRLTAGFAPPSSAIDTVAEILFTPLLRIISLVYLLRWQAIVRRQRFSSRAHN